MGWVGETHSTPRNMNDPRATLGPILGKSSKLLCTMQCGELVRPLPGRTTAENCALFAVKAFDWPWPCIEGLDDLIDGCHADGVKN